MIMRIFAAIGMFNVLFCLLMIFWAIVLHAGDQIEEWDEDDE